MSDLTREIKWSRRSTVRRLAIGLAGTFLITSAAAVSPAAASAERALGQDKVDTGTLTAIAEITGAHSMWERGFIGQGIDVAVIDTGVARVDGLHEPDKVIDGPDLSFDSQDPALAHTDAFGHGTHMAGIIAGSDVPAGSKTGKKSPYTDPDNFVGIAPGSRIVNVKIGASDGSVDVSQVIAAIDWVVQHRADSTLSPPLNIKVISLSFGTDSLQPAAVDPLVHAAEMAWKAGILVVVAGGNDGRHAGPLGNPAISPVVLAVGASDPRGTLAREDDRVPKFAEHGTKERPVDVVAPGVSVISFAVPGSFVDQNVTTGKVGTRFQRGTGTSQSSAVVAGLAALLFSQFPNATPDQIKALLMATASPIKISASKHYAGSGSVDLSSVTNKTKLSTNIPAPVYGNGLGSLEAARGTGHVAADGVELVGEQDIFGNAWDPAVMAPLTEAWATWNGGIWNGAQWTADGFSPVDPAADWSSVKWSSVKWSSVKWSSVKWTGTDWTSVKWSSVKWTGTEWTSVKWSSVKWAAADWS